MTVSCLESSTTQGKGITKAQDRQVIVMICVRVGKEFPDMRQKEGRIEFIRVRDAVRIAGLLKGESTPFSG